MKRVQEFTPDRPAELKRQLGQLEENVQAALVAAQKPGELRKIYVRRSEDYQVSAGITAVCDDGSSPRLTVTAPPADFRRFVVVKKLAAGAMLLIGAECTINGAPSLALTDLGAYEFLAVDGDWTRVSPAASSGGGGSSAGYGAFSARPAPGTAGDTYYASDAVVGEWVDDGSRWHPLIGGIIGEEVPSLTAFNGAWTIFNPGAGPDISVAGTPGGLIFSAANGSALNNRGWSHPAATSGNISIEAAFADLSSQFGGSGRFTIFGVGLRRAATGEAYMLSLARSDEIGAGVYFFDVSGWTNDTTRPTFSQPRTQNFADDGAPVFLRARRFGSNFEAHFSRDRVNWWSLGGGGGLPFVADQVVIASDMINVPNGASHILRHMVISV